MNKKNKAWLEEVRKKSNNHKVNDTNIEVKKVEKQPSHREYEFIQKAYIKTKTKSSTVLNQFVCLECNNINLVEELLNRETKLYADKEIPCRCCKKETTQICIRDKTITKAQLDMTTSRTPEEERAYRAISPQTKEISKCSPKQKRKRKRKRKPKREASSTRGTK